ncbi:hypothetical protein CK203_062378 [Vitis vinifera]|uniref:Uncharacterized protein n=1 Tax=Vitis vinifera TaxID=29760 RepID=A0A438FSN7_VITVI|nr:hypothetical protein CK203_062378 [Vitis vinifera]
MRNSMECWERYMEAINACPHHGFDTWLLVSYFYDGMSSSNESKLLETMCGGDFMSKNPEEAMDFLTMTRSVEELELKIINEVQAVAETPVQVKPCSIFNLMNTWWRSALQFQLLEKCMKNKQMSLDNSSPIAMLRMAILIQLKLEESSKFFMEAKSTSVPTTGSTHLNHLTSFKS